MLLKNNSKTNSFTAHHLISLVVLSLIVVLCICNFTNAATCNSSCSNTANTSVQSHWEVLDKEISELTCQQQRLNDSLTLLKLNSTLNSEIIVMRSKHLEKITKAISLLTRESQYLKYASSPKPVQFSSVQPFEYEDGTRANSCRDYRKSASYSNQGSGLYNIEPSNGLVMTVYCDMTTDGGGWTLISGIRNDYAGIHFHTFEDSTAVSTSNVTSFHIKTAALLVNSTQVRAASDSAISPITTFYLSSWPYSAYCEMTTALRNAIQNTPTINNGDLPANNCTILAGAITKPTHFTYGKTAQTHPTGFRMGTPAGSGYTGQMNTATSYYTLSFTGAPEGSAGIHLGVNSLGGQTARNGAVFLR